MEITLLCLVFITALFFTAFSYFAKNNWAFAVIAGVAWISLAMSMTEVVYYGYDSFGNKQVNQIQMGDPYTSGMIGNYYLFWGIGMVMLLLSAGWILTSSEVGDEV
jgi:hypothetical protein